MNLGSILQCNDKCRVEPYSWRPATELVYAAARHWNQQHSICWKHLGTKLFDGNWGVAVFNESGNTVPATNFTVKWQSLGLNTNAYVHVYDPYNGFDFGTNQNSLTLNLSYGTGRLLQFDVLPIQQIPQLILSGILFGELRHAATPESYSLWGQP